jgi:dipeptidase
MKGNKYLLSLIVIAFVIVFSISYSFAQCTIYGVGTKATVDGSTITTHNDDSGVADYRLWIIPELEHPEGATRNIVIDSHDYVDHGNWPEVDYTPNEDTRNGALIVEEMPEAEHTYARFHSRYSFINNKGLTMGESTFGQGNTSTDLGREIRQVLRDDSPGIIDCWFAQDIALERAKTAREAVRVIGDLVEEYRWYGSGEIINISDGNDVWIMETYGWDLWVAVRMPDDHFFVGANTARIREIDLDDEENVMHSPNLISFAVEHGWYDPETDGPFHPADVYAPRPEGYWNPREWRAIDLVAPSLGVEPYQTHYPLFVKPDNLLSVHDIFIMSGDVYRGTEFDLTKGPGAGPWGDPLGNYRIAGRERPIGIPLTCYVQIGHTKSWLPEPIKSVVWYGYGAVDSTYVTPLWPAMEKLPEFYQVGSRYQGFRRDSGWWVNSYVQQMARFRYNEAIEDIREVREPRMETIYKQTAALQEAAGEIYEIDPETALQLISDFAYNTAVSWNKTWLELGDELMGKYAFDRVNVSGTMYPDWWIDWLTRAVEEIEVVEVD